MAGRWPRVKEQNWTSMLLTWSRGDHRISSDGSVSHMYLGARVCAEG